MLITFYLQPDPACKISSSSTIQLCVLYSMHALTQKVYSPKGGWDQNGGNEIRKPEKYFFHDAISENKKPNQIVIYKQGMAIFVIKVDCIFKAYCGKYDCQRFLSWKWVVSLCLPMQLGYPMLLALIRKLWWK